MHGTTPEPVTRVLILLFPVTPCTTHIAARIAGHLLVREARARILPGCAVGADELALSSNALLIHELDGSLDDYVTDTATRWQRALFIRWSPTPLSALAFSSLFVGTRSGGQLASILRYYGASELLEPQEVDNPTGPRVDTWCRRVSCACVAPRRGGLQSSAQPAPSGERECEAPCLNRR